MAGPLAIKDGALLFSSGSGGATVAGACCFRQEINCVDGTPTGQWARTTSFDLTKFYKDGEACYGYTGLVSPCLPSGADERTSAPGDVYDDCTACRGGWLQVYDCATSAPLSIGGHTYWIEAYKVSDASKIWKVGSGGSAKCYYFPSAAVSTPGDSGRLEGSLKGPYPDCEYCKYGIRCATGEQIDVAFAGISVCCGVYGATSDYTWVGVNSTFRLTRADGAPVCTFTSAVQIGMKPIYPTGTGCTGATSSFSGFVEVTISGTTFTATISAGGESNDLRLAFSGTGTGTTSGGIAIPPGSISSSITAGCGSAIAGASPSTRAASGGTAVITSV